MSESPTGDELSRLLYEACPDAVIAIDDHGTILFTNPAVREMFGYAPEELVGEPLTTLQPPRLHDAHTRGLARYLETGARKLDWRATRTFALHRGGREFPVEIAFTAIAPGRFGGFIRDLTSRVETERALEASEARYRELLDNANDIIYAYDLDGRIIYVNRTALRVYGYTLEEALNLNIRDIVEPAQLEAAVGRVERSLQDTGLEAPYELLTRSRTGEAIWVEASPRVIRDASGTPVGVQGIARDITERRLAEQELAREREFRERVMDAATNAIAAFDLEGRMTLVNQRLCELSGYSPEELLGQRLNATLRPGATSAVPQALRRVMAGESIDNVEFVAVRKDGTPFTLRATLRPLKDGDCVVGVVGTAEDITEQERREEALARTLAFRDRVLESTTNAIGAFDLEGRLTLVNRRLCEMTGFSEDELLGQRIGGLITPGFDPDAPSPVLQCAATGESVDDLEFNAVRKDGTSFTARATLRPLRDGDRIIGVIGTAEDITERKRADEALRESEERYRQMFQSTSAVRLLIDPETRRIIEPNDAACTYYGYRRAQLTGMDVATINTRKPEEISELMAEALRTGRTFFEVEHRLASGEVRSVEIYTGPVDVSGKRYLLTTVFDVTERKRVEARLAEQSRLLAEKSSLLESALASERERARRDPLTGALNHAVIADEVGRLIDERGTRSFVLAMVDVDGLKAVNDTYGHQMGDQVLLAVASSLRAEGAIVGRYGGDEFVAILPDADREEAASYKQRVTEALAAVELRDPETNSRIHIDASIGLAIYPEEGDAVEDLIKLSDSAMYASRRQRTDLSAPAAFARIHGGDRAAELVGEIVPFLTSPGDLQEKLNLVAARVNTGAGYDGVSFQLYGNAGPRARSASFSEDAGATDRWDAESVPPEEPGPMHQVLEATRRPVIIDDVATTEFTTPEQKEILASVGIRSGLVVPMIWRGTLVGAISVGSKRPAAFGPRDAQFLTAIATQVTSIVRTAALVDDLQAASDRLLQAQTETVLMLAAAAEAHDDTTGRHLQRVRQIAQALALELGHGDASSKEIGLAAVLHDIGKIRVPDYVLASSASLSDTEWTLMKEHTVWGSEFLGSRGGFELAMQVARSHHERWDGSGYPDGLAGARIPEAAAITSVADSLDAMISDRPYRPGRPLEDAIQEVEAWSGRQFSPQVVDALLALYARGDLAYLTDDEATRKLAA